MDLSIRINWVIWSPAIILRNYVRVLSPSQSGRNLGSLWPCAEPNLVMLAVNPPCRKLVPHRGVSDGRPDSPPGTVVARWHPSSYPATNAFGHGFCRLTDPSAGKRFPSQAGYPANMNSLAQSDQIRRTGRFRDPISVD